MDANLKNANLQGANLKHADFTGADFDGTLLCGAEFDMDFKLQEWNGNPIWEKDCFGICGGDMTITKDKCGVCGGKNEPNTGSCDCKGLPNGSAIIDACGICGGEGDGSDCNNNGILDICEEIYEDSLNPNSKLTDLNNDGSQDILDVVKLVENILK